MRSLEALLTYKGLFSKSGLERFTSLLFTQDASASPDKEPLTSLYDIKQALVAFFMSIKRAEATGKKNPCSLLRYT